MLDDSRLGRTVELSRGLKKARPGEGGCADRFLAEGEAPYLRPPYRADREGGHGADRAALFDRQHELPDKFPPAALRELGTLPPAEAIGKIAAADKRADLRSLPAVTIDGAGAKDFDDAVSLETLPKGGYRLGVHIADVSHYVSEGRAIDREALKRGTSTYLVERAVHMLPPLLSEDLCSLRAG